MRILLITSHIIFLSGFILKFFHIHHNAILMLIGLGCLLLTAVVSLFTKRSKVYKLLIITNFSWFLLLFASVKFLPFKYIVLVIAVILTLVTIYVTYKSDESKSLRLVGVSMIIALLFCFMPSHKLFKLMSINWNYEIETDYITWDKYSWFLYQNGEYEEALEVSSHAREIALKLEDLEWVEIIDMHKTSIENKNWVRFK